MKIIYIHGFNSGGTGNDKAKLLADTFPDVVAPDLPPSPDLAVAALIKLVDSYRDVNGHLPDDLILVGTSLGGFYARYLSVTFGIKVVLINPSLDPSVSLAKHIGKQHNFTTGVDYIWTAADVDQLSKYYVGMDTVRIPTVVCLDLDDEVLDARATAHRFASTAKLLLFPGGNHRFTHMANILPDIAALAHVIYD